jgi:uncharacterized protein YecE (DUF72 family)
MPMTPACSANEVSVGTAGWVIPRACLEAFPGAGSHLTRYALHLPVAEIDSTFYRSHPPSTYERWAESVPDGFRFAVKLPREITHVSRLRNSRHALEIFVKQVAYLGPKLGPLLIQLPAALEFELSVTCDFLRLLRLQHAGPVVCEPRHATWFTAEAAACLKYYCVARVASDPAMLPAAAEPAGCAALAYYRLHGPRHQQTCAYTDAEVRSLADTLLLRAAQPDIHQVWCVFDNTTHGAALNNAVRLDEILSAERLATSRPRGVE